VADPHAEDDDAEDDDAEDDDAEDDSGQDPGLAVVRHVADKSTVRSVKETLLTAMLVRSVRGPRLPPRRSKGAMAAGALIALPVLAHGQLGDLLTSLW
jgi:hypothetical protein